jgi:hypothetical protein
MKVADIRKIAHEQVQSIIASDASASDLMRIARGSLSQASLLEGDGDLRMSLRLGALYKCAGLLLAFIDSEEVQHGPRWLQRFLVEQFIEFAKVYVLSL